MIDKVNGQVFVINHAVGGGTCSGLGALILERIADKGMDEYFGSFNPSSKHYLENGMYHLELKYDNELLLFNDKLIGQNKQIEHLKYRNMKLQMQIHLKQTLSSDFLIIFESGTSFKNSFISSINFNYNKSSQNMNLIKSYNNNSKGIIFKRVKDCSYTFASNVYIDKIIGITTKSRQQHIQSCISTLNNCICTFNIIYRI